MLQQRLAKALSLLAMAALAALLRPPAAPAPQPPADRDPNQAAPPAESCLLFAAPCTCMHSNQLLVASRVVGIARVLGCRVLPLFMSHGPARDWGHGDIPLEAFYLKDPPSDVFVDLEGEDAAWVRGLAAANGMAVLPGEKPQGNKGDAIRDRAAFGLHQYRNVDDRVLSLPCLVGPHSLGDPRLANFTQPFRCSELVVLREWATHPDYVEPASRDTLLHGLRRRLSGRLVGIPQPFLLNLSCTVEQDGSAEIPPRRELLRAAKWILWNGVLSGPRWRGMDSAGWEANVLGKIGRTPAIPELDEPEYARYPVPVPSLNTAHVRSGSNHVAYCAHRLRFPLCATTDDLAADALLAIAKENASLPPDRRIIFVAGDTIRHPSAAHAHAATDLGASDVLVRRLEAGISASGPSVRYAAGMQTVYRAVLSHPSLNFTDQMVMPARHGAGREDAFWDLAYLVTDQILLGCGDRVSPHVGEQGAFRQTYWSTFSMRARTLGATIGAAVCLPSGSPAGATDPRMHGAEWAAQDAAMTRAGVDFSVLHSHHAGPKRTQSSRGWMLGCMAKGAFLPAIPFGERMGTEVKCPWCGPEGKW